MGRGILADKVVEAFLAEMARTTDPQEKLEWAEKISVYSSTKKKRKNAGKPSGRKGISTKKNFARNYGTPESDARIRSIGAPVAKPEEKNLDNALKFFEENKPNATE